MITVPFLIIVKLAKIMIMVSVMEIIMVGMGMETVLTIVPLLIKHDRESAAYHHHHHHHHLLLLLRTMIHQLLLVLLLLNLDPLPLLLHNLGKPQFFQLHQLSLIPLTSTEFHSMLSANSIHPLLPLTNSLQG